MADVGPGFVATTLSELGVPAPNGIVTWTQLMLSVELLELVTVSVYDVAEPVTADVGLIAAVKFRTGASVNVVCACELVPLAVR